MATIFRIFFFFTVFGLGFLLIVSWYLAQKGSYYKASFKEKHLEFLKKTTGDLIENLIPIDLHELKILAWKLIPHPKVRKVSAGFVQTIFQEKLFAYAAVGNSDDSLVEVVTSEVSYTYERSGDLTKVFLSDVLMGTIEERNALIALDNGKSQYKVNSLGLSKATIYSNEKNLAQVYIGDPTDSFSDSDRLFTMIHNLETEEIENLTILVLYLLLVKNKIDV